MSLVLSNNYANLGSLSYAVTENKTTGTMLVVFRTGATVPAGGIFTLYNATVNQYMGFRVVGTTIEAGIRSGGGTPAVVVASVQPNTTYYLSLKKTAAGAVSCRVNSNAAVTKTVSVASTGYNRLGVGTYYNATNISTTVGQVAYARYYSDSISDAQLDLFHSNNLLLMSNTNLQYSYDLLSDLNSDVGGTALTFVDPESDPPVFDSYDPFAPLYDVSDINGGDPLSQNQSITWSVSGFTSNINYAEVDDIPFQSAGNTGGITPELVDESYSPRPGTRTFTVSNALSQTASENVEWEPPTDYSYTTLAGTLNFGVGSVIPPGSVAGDFIYFPDVVGGEITYSEVDPDGTGRTNYTGQQLYWHIRGSDGYTRNYRLITGEIVPEDLDKFKIVKPIVSSIVKTIVK